MPWTHKLLLTLAAGAALAVPLIAEAQWAWRDAGGRMVYSDQPPPKSIPPKDIVRQPVAPAGPQYTPAPENRDDAPAGARPVAEPARPPAKAAAPSLADRELEARRRQQQLAEAQKKSADEEARKTQQADNCTRLRSYLRALDDGHRIGRINAAGEREILDDDARAAETARTRALIDQQCR